MNLLLFEKDELHGSTLRLSDRRARHIQQVLRSEPGDTLRVGMVNGLRGTGKVLRVDNIEVELAVNLTSDPTPTLLSDLILALPRPIMLRRILKQATVLGVRRIHLIRASKVEKSYFQSPVLQPQAIKELLTEGLEQAMDTRLPSVHIHHRFKPFIEDVAPDLPARCRLIAHPEVEGGLRDLFLAGVELEDIVLAVGPEGGWTDYELEQFQDQGFHGFSMGSRILNVDTAVVALLAQLQLLRDLRSF